MELIIESHLNDIHDLVSHLNVQITELDTTATHMALQLDTARNQLLSYSTFFSLVSMGLAFGSMIFGLFGMNLNFKVIQGDPLYFILIVVTTLSIVVLIVLVISLILVYKKMILS